jgi:dTDP-glucose 4,6-dehydratase
MPEINGKRRRIPIYDRGLAVREWLNTKDYAQAILFALQNGTIGETYNVGSGNRCRNRDLLRCIFQACQPYFPQNAGFQTLAEISFDATKQGMVRPGHDLCYSINCNKIQKLGWRAQYAENLEEQIKITVDWYAKHPEWWQPIWSSHDFTEFWDKKYRKIMESSSPCFVFYDERQEKLEDWRL